MCSSEESFSEACHEHEDVSEASIILAASVKPALFRCKFRSFLVCPSSRAHLALYAALYGFYLPSTVLRVDQGEEGGIMEPVKSRYMTPMPSHVNLAYTLSHTDTAERTRADAGAGNQGLLGRR